MTNSRDTADSSGEEGEERLDEIRPVSSSLRPAQTQGCDVDTSEATDVSDPDQPKSDAGGLDELAPVSSVLRPGQVRIGDEDSDGEGDDD